MVWGGGSNFLSFSKNIQLSPNHFYSIPSFATPFKYQLKILNSHIYFSFFSILFLIQIIYCFNFYSPLMCFAFGRKKKTLPTSSSKIIGSDFMHGFKAPGRPYQFTLTTSSKCKHLFHFTLLIFPHMCFIYHIYIF